MLLSVFGFCHRLCKQWKASTLAWPEWRELDRRDGECEKPGGWTVCREEVHTNPRILVGHIALLGGVVGLKVMTLLPSMEGMCCLPATLRSSVRAPDMDTASSRGWCRVVPGSSGLAP